MNNTRIKEIMNRMQELEYKIEQEQPCPASIFTGSFEMEPYIHDQAKEDRLSLLYKELSELENELNTGDFDE